MMQKMAYAVFILWVVVMFAWTWPRASQHQEIPRGREEVVFWHFWGGDDLKVVRSIVDRFNRSQTEYWVREIAMPGNNLQSKLFLSIGGGTPPDLVNQDDPIIVDWSRSGLITPLDEFVDESSLKELEEWMLPAARRLTQYDGRWMGVSNALDIRALYYNRTALSELGLDPPRTLEELDKLVDRVEGRPVDDRATLAFVPDSRRLWAWAIVFGGTFVDESGNLTIDHPKNIAALRWMQSFAARLGVDRLAAYRQADQSLPGKTFPLLPTGESTLGRYLFVMDGQWRVRDIESFQAARLSGNGPAIEFGVCPLPPPTDGRPDAGWLNANFFVVPRGARNPLGAYAFMKFWIGLGAEGQAAETCAAGGWLPVSSHVMDHPKMTEFRKAHPLFEEFLRLSQSRHQVPYPMVPNTDELRREVNQAVFRCMNDLDTDPESVLHELQASFSARSEAAQ